MQQKNIARRLQQRRRSFCLRFVSGYYHTYSIRNCMWSLLQSLWFSIFFYCLFSIRRIHKTVWAQNIHFCFVLSEFLSWCTLDADVYFHIRRSSIHFLCISTTFFVQCLVFFISCVHYSTSSVQKSMKWRKNKNFNGLWFHQRVANRRCIQCWFWDEKQ